MNTNRLLLGTFAGFLGYFMGGYVFYTVLFADMLAQTNPGMASVQRAPDMAALIVGNLAGSLLLAWVFERWANIRSIYSGAFSGAFIGFLISLSYDSMIHGTSTLMTWNGVLTDVFIYTLLSAVAGALVAFGLSFNRVK